MEEEREEIIKEIVEVYSNMVDVDKDLHDYYMDEICSVEGG